MTAMIFHAVELSADTGTPVSLVPARGWGSAPRGAFSTRPTIAASPVLTVRLSDAGYVRDDGTPYPPLISQAFAIDRRLDLAPSAQASAETWGSVEIANARGSLDALIQSCVVDRMPLRIFAGAKSFDAARGLWTDPAYASLKPMFSGLGRTWQPDLGTVSVALRDASYWLDNAMPTGTYGGTGGRDGDANAAGRNMPRLRGTVANLTPVLIDAGNLVYQISDGPAQVSALYEGGYAGGITSAGTVADIYASAPSAGTYTVQSSATGSYLRLGSKPVYAITLDATGGFPSGAAPSGGSPAGVLDLLRQMLIEDAGIPAAYIAGGWPPVLSWAAWPGGWYWDGSASVTGGDVVQTWLAGLGVRLVTTRSGTLLPVRVAVPTGQPVATLTTDQVIAISAVGLDDSLDPPAYRWRVGYQHNMTVQAAGSGLSPQATSDRQAFIALADRTASWISTAVQRRYRVPNDPPLLVTALARQADAQAVAASHGALWGAGRRVWAVSLPKAIAYGLDLGDPVSVTWPVPGLSSGAIGLVVGEQVRSQDATVTIQVLV